MSLLLAGLLNRFLLNDADHREGSHLGGLSSGAYAASSGVISASDDFDFDSEADWTESSFLLFANQSTDEPLDSNLCNTTQSGTSDKDLTYKIVINVLVFITVLGISSVVDPEEFKASFRKPPIYAGAAFQFLLMPFIGFITVLIFPFEPLEAVALLILCASPGGSFSNWWCNLFNADLALSVSMTSLSTICSIGMLPLNILVYISVAYERTATVEGDKVTVEFGDLGLTLGIVIGGIILGLTFGSKFPQYQNQANVVGNITGMASILLGVFASADTCDGKAPWQQAFFPLWVGTGFPLLVSLLGVTFLSGFLGLTKPQRVAIALETAYQNTSISLAYTISQGDAGRRASGVSVIYGGYEAGFFFIFMVSNWKLGWTFAPPNEAIWKVLFQNWQPGSDNYKRLHPEEYPDEKKDVPDESGDAESDERKEVDSAKVIEMELEDKGKKSIKVQVEGAKDPQVTTKFASQLSL